MHQAAMRHWNEIAQMGKVKREPWASLFRLTEQEIGPALEAMESGLGISDTQTILGYRLVAPLLLENEAISDYIEATGQLELRSSMPEILDLTEAVKLASMEYHLSDSQQATLRQLLVDAYRAPMLARNQGHDLTTTPAVTELAASQSPDRPRRRAFDSELTAAGVVLAGAHIEAGARTFAEYARAMVDDLGNEVKPYLKSWYACLWFDPEAAFLKSGMTPPAELDALDVDSALTEHHDTPSRDALRKQALQKMLALPPKQRQRLAKLELMRRGLDPSRPPEKG